MNQLSDHRRELGLTTTFYSCTGDYPTNFMISDPGDNYWTIWYTMTLGTDGFMRWAWDNYVYDMHGDTSYRYWEPGDGWYVYPVERDQIDADYNASFYSTPRYEMLKQGMRDVAKAKYLMEQSDEYKTEITTLTKSMKLPVKSTYHGSATYADEVQRMLVHSETDRMYDKVTEIAREYAATQVVVDKSLLEAEIEKAEKLTEKDYTADSWKELAAALKVAKDVEADTDATQDDVDKAYEALEAAVAGLKKVDPSIPDEVYKGDLTASIHKAEALTEDHYTADTWKELAAALKVAKAVEADVNATQDDVDEAYEALEAAVEGLEKVNPSLPDEVYKGDLTANIKKAEALAANQYTTESWKVLEAALKAAKAVEADADATQEDVDAARHVLENAIKDLVKVDTADPDPKPNPLPDNPIKPNEPMNPGYVNQIHNNKNEVTVIGKFHEDVQLIVEALAKEAKAEIIQKIKNKNDLTKYSIEKIYDIYMLRQGAVYTPSGSFTIKIKLDDELLAKRYLGIVDIADDGKATIVPSKVENGYITFTTNHNSYYAIVSSDSPIVNTAASSSMIDMSGFLSVMLGMLLVFTTKKSNSLLRKESD